MQTVLFTLSFESRRQQHIKGFEIFEFTYTLHI